MLASEQQSLEHLSEPKYKNDEISISKTKEGGEHTENRLEEKMY